jgi:hypothetical protein
VALRACRLRCEVAAAHGLSLCRRVFSQWLLASAGRRRLERLAARTFRSCASAKQLRRICFCGWKIFVSAQTEAAWRVLNGKSQISDPGALESDEKAQENSWHALDAAARGVAIAEFRLREKLLEGSDCPGRLCAHVSPAPYATPASTRQVSAATPLRALDTNSADGNPRSIVSTSPSLDQLPLSPRVDHGCKAPRAMHHDKVSPSQPLNAKHSRKQQKLFECPADDVDGIASELCLYSPHVHVERSVSSTGV